MGDYDILTLEEAQATTRALSAGNAELLGPMVEGLSGWVDRLCGPVVAREVTAFLSGGCGPLLFIDTPVYEVSEVIETTGVTPATLTEDDWQLDADGHYARLFRRTSGVDSAWAHGRRNIEVTYLAGRFETTDTVGYDWKERFRSLLAAKWQYEAPMWARNRGEFPTDEGGNVATFDAEAMIRALFASELLPPGIA